MNIDYDQKIPNNVDLAGDKTLQRALEHWQPEFLNWWADMGPDGMKEMTAPVKALPPKEPGVYLFEVEPGMAGGWMLTLAAKVQGEAETVRGSVTVKLAK